jgi:tetratricopeptide (TPR) repeat protein
VDASLVIPNEVEGDEPRFTMLETIREFALEQSGANGEELGTRRAHAEFYTWLAEDALPYYDGPELPQYNDRVNREMDNCRAAMTWALDTGAHETGIRLAGALWRVWMFSVTKGVKPWRDRVIEGRSWCRRMLARREGLPVEALTEAMIGGAITALWSDDLDEAKELADELLSRARLENYAYGEWWACHLLGNIAGERGRDVEAATWHEVCRDIAPRIRNPENHASMSLWSLAQAVDRLGRPWEAAELLESSVELSRRSGNPYILAMAQMSLGRVLRRQGSPGCLQGAYASLGDVLAWSLRRQDIGHTHDALVELACLAKQAGEVEIAARFL